MSASRISEVEESLDSLHLEEAKSPVKHENPFTCLLCVNKSSGKPFVGTSAIFWEQHILGKQHRKRAEAERLTSLASVSQPAVRVQDEPEPEPELKFEPEYVDDIQFHPVRGNCIVDLYCGFCNMEFHNDIDLDRHIRSKGHRDSVVACGNFYDAGFDSGFVQGLIYAGLSKSSISSYLEGSGILPEFSESEAVFAAERTKRFSQGEGILLPPLSLCYHSLNKPITDIASESGNAGPFVATTNSIEESSRRYSNFEDDDDLDDFDDDADDDY
jgi:hypothetical protein